MVATADKIALIDRLSATGLQSIEATSFVSPKWVPQLADAAEVFAGITRKPGVHYPVLVPNEQGYERARGVGVEEIAVFTAASEAFNQKNINASIDESLARFAPVMARARHDGVRVRGYVSTVLGCPYQGEVPLADVVRVARAPARDGLLRDLARRHHRRRHAAQGARDAEGGRVARYRCRRSRSTSTTPTARRWPTSSPAWKKAWRWSTAAVSGAGGCPYAKGASGNVASEDVVYMLHGLGIADRHRPARPGRNRPLARGDARPRNRQQGRQGTRGVMTAQPPASGLPDSR